jgi:anti-anti-sigma factor
MAESLAKSSRAGRCPALRRETAVVTSSSIALRLTSQPVPEFRAGACLAPPHADPPGSQAWLPAREVARVAEVGYRHKMINGAPVVAAPAEIEITTAEQLRAVLLDTTSRGHAAVVVDMTRTRFCDCCGLHTLLPRTSRPRHPPLRISDAMHADQTQTNFRPARDLRRQGAPPSERHAYTPIQDHRFRPLGHGWS